jgi:hypothetical protein
LAADSIWFSRSNVSLDAGNVPLSPSNVPLDADNEPLNPDNELLESQVLVVPRPEEVGEDAPGEAGGGALLLHGFVEEPPNVGTSRFSIQRLAERDLKTLEG